MIINFCFAGISGVVVECTAAYVAKDSSGAAGHYFAADLTCDANARDCLEIDHVEKPGSHLMCLSGELSS